MTRYKQGMRVIDYPLCKKCRNKHKDLAAKAERMEKIARQKAVNQGRAMRANGWKGD